MLQMAFEPQICRVIEGEDTPGVDNGQTLMISATFSRDLKKFADGFFKRCSPPGNRTMGFGVGVILDKIVNGIELVFPSFKVASH